ncbi:hypothetical protein KU6B_39280 [Mameliella alba]|nr:hypothetical protein KU6B_39280 [Mameliella alba]
MQKTHLPERPHWRDHAKEVGFTFADMHGEPYWDESSAYAFTLDQIENDLEDPATELHSMCREAVSEIITSERLMTQLGIPENRRDLVANSWKQGDPEIYGRFDFAYDGKGPAKLLEYNADTPTSLYESAAFQWQWLEDQLAAGVLPEGTDQFNGIHEALVARFDEVFEANSDLHFTAVAGNPEDYGTVEAMGWAAREAGLGAHYCDLDKIGLSEDGQFLDDEDRRIAVLFKLYPWEDLFLDDYTDHIDGSGCLFLEPAWKALLSNKGCCRFSGRCSKATPTCCPPSSRRISPMHWRARAVPPPGPHRHSRGPKPTWPQAMCASRSCRAKALRCRS